MVEIEERILGINFAQDTGKSTATGRCEIDQIANRIFLAYL
jgi:hypothetical protein